MKFQEKKDGDCNNRDFQIFLAGVHNIQESDFVKWTEYFNAKRLNGKNISTVDLLAKINDQPCEIWHVAVGPANGEGDPDSNADIGIDLMATVTKSYSIALFKGIITFFAPDQFYFYKARKAPDNFDIIFKAEKAGETVYYGNLSSLP